MGVRRLRRCAAEALFRARVLPYDRPMALPVSELRDAAGASIDASIAALIARAESGDAAARSELFAALYERLHHLARREVARYGDALTLSTTTLLHEVYLDMSQREGPTFPDQARFLAYAARAMRGVVIDHLRERQALKRGGHLHITDLDTHAADALPWQDNLLPIHEALEELEALDPALAQIVDLKFFCGFSLVEVAALQRVSERTVQRHWEKARALLHQALRPADTAG
jgi:RNA polymerase sigma factor (TIGR02999 family)